MLRVELDDAAHAQAAAALLAAGAEEEHRARQRHAALLEVDHRQHLGDGDALHVEDAAAVDPGELDARLERRREPLLGIGRRDVDVVVQHQRPGVLAHQPGVEVGLARAHLLDAVGDAGRLELAGEEARRP